MFIWSEQIFVLHISGVYMCNATHDASIKQDNDLNAIYVCYLLHVCKRNIFYLFVGPLVVVKGFTCEIDFITNRLKSHLFYIKVLLCAY